MNTNKSQEGKATETTARESSASSSVKCSLADLKNKKPVFLNNWSNKIDVIGDFEDIYMTGEEYKAKKAPYANVRAWEEKKTSNETCS